MSDRPTARSDQRRPAPSLVLMGLRGCGKSTLGRLAAQRAGVAFVDLDGVVAQALGGGSISDIWSRLGEARFREAEREALAALRLGGPDPGARVIALGGGTPTAPGAAAMLADAADAGAISLVYLFAAPDLLRSRLALGGAGDRPSLTGAGTLAEIE
ncbi:MAG TPA: shikimate kinase, partial [Phycisphaerales bacterium]|nr:shikimate kinase [Phycisphaerales bacterium]